MNFTVPNPLFYFSGTGGSLHAAKRISAELPEFSPVPIAALEGEESVMVDADAVGFAFPLFYAGLPNIVERFLKKLNFAKPCYVFVVVPCGFPWSGYALHQLNSLLRKKRQKLSAGFYLKMVDNYLPHFDMPDEKAQEPYYQAVDEKLGSVIDVIRNKEKTVEHEKGFLLYPSHFIYAPGFARQDTNYTVDATCNSCGICQKVCPVNNVELKDGKPVWLHKCEFCLACIQYCPQKAIQWKDITRKKGRYHYKGISAGEIAKQKTL
jgi:ferredoxin